MTTTRIGPDALPVGRGDDSRGSRVPSLVGIMSTMFGLLAGAPHALREPKVRTASGQAASYVGESMEDQRDPVIRCDGPCL